jgi:hypothetical protein
MLILQLVALLGLVVGTGCEARAQQVAASPATPMATAPVPTGLLAARKVFVSNAGADSGLFPHPFSGTPERAYIEFYTALQAWGRYELVVDPQEADLVFELQLTAPNGPTNANKQKGASDPLPMLRLVIFDRKTHYVLWALTESIEPANLQKTHDRNFDNAIDAIILDLKDVMKG